MKIERGAALVADRKEPDRRVALVTGASRGIGRMRGGGPGPAGLRRRHHGTHGTRGRGPRPVRRARRRPRLSTPIAGSLETTAAEIEALGRSCLAIPMDLMDRQSIHQVADEVLGQWGRVDVLFNNAIYQGPGTMDRVLDLPLELAERCLVGDYLHPLLLIQLLLPQMLERGEGRLVNMLSEAAFTTPPAPAGEGGWGRRLRRRQGGLPPGDRHVPRGVLRRRGLVLQHRPRPHPHRVHAGIGHGQGADRRRLRPGPAGGGGRSGRVARRTTREAKEFAGQMVSSRPLCKKLGLVEGWPPPKR